ncbi:hypothetical protein BCY91_15770 [Pelobium manganitolerans]|uniref:Uncharacterized protein n=1 Tax=Pelobium manganitolerans TaxID=1842495 RepID=A0A419S930_9SPHI|nr:hypothetical protein BCY91_15770 [Pelobium manganitolerans]
MLYRYRFLILCVLLGTLVNVCGAFFGSLLLRTILLELSLLVFFLALFAKRKDRKEVEKASNHEEGLKIYL